MALETFEKEIEFLKKDYDEKTDTWPVKPIKKTATFKKLSAVDRSQHKLHFKILSLASAFGNDAETDQISIDTDVLYDLTVKSIKTLLVVDDKFTAADKEEFLSDSLALLNFGLWMLTSETIPFFSKFSSKLNTTQ